MTRNMRKSLVVLLATVALPMTVQAQTLGAQGFSISRGETVIAGSTPPPYRPGLAPVDEALRRADVTVQFDSLERTQRLNVLTEDLGEAYAPGEVISFRTSANYPAFIEAAEIRILDRTQPGRQVVAVLPVDPNGTASWTMPADAPGEMAYVLRVTGTGGQFDETIPALLSRVDSPVEAPELTGPVSAAGEGEDRTAIRAIPIRGGTVTVSGTGATPGSTLRVMGETVEVDASGRFAATRILPTGDQVVEVEIGGRRFLRDVHIPESDWFRTGIIDITAGQDRFGDDTYVDGRAAIYANGRTASGWRIVASADTQEGPIEDMFSRLDDRDPLRVLDRLREDGTDLYPTYGDDSTWIDTTPTSGNVYLRAENENYRILWGDFTANVTGPGLMRYSRDLYGLEGAYQSTAQTEDGAPRLSAQIFAATPDSLPQRDILQGTGGSVYFLSRRDLVGGSTSVTIEETDADTGFVVTTRRLSEGQDYRVDHLQGVLILDEPLSSGTSDGTLISGAGDERVLNLVVQYEYAPTAGDLGDNSYGGRVETWVTDDLRLGATFSSDETSAGRQEAAGVDLSYQIGEASSFDLEVAQTEGPGFGRASSTDGGLTLATSGPGTDVEARAYEARLRLQFSDLGLAADGGFEAYIQSQDSGFETISETVTDDQMLYGISVDLGLGPRTRLGFDGEGFDSDSGEERREAELRLSHELNAMWTLTGALAWLDQTDPTDPSDTGTRTDAALRLTYAPRDSLSVYGFVQGTVDVSGGLEENNRAGLGVEADLGERISASAEVSGGDGGAAGRARLSWRPTDDNEIYLGYSLDPTRSDGSDGPLDDNGRVVAGASYRVSDTLSTFGETVWDMPDDQRSLTQAYGVTYTPSSTWTFTGGIETAAITDSADGDFDRTGFSIGTAWTPSEEQSGRVRLEFRTEDGAGTTRDRDTWAMTAGYSVQTAEDWRLITSIDALFSDSAAGATEDGEYLRADLGYAYRPIDNERLNMLFRLSVLQDQPGDDQRNASGSTSGSQQRSVILSAAGNYDLSEAWTLSGVLGHRMGETAPRGTDTFTSNTATLGALRLDWHVVDQWDLMAEGRVLYTEETGTSETGALLGVYRHVNDQIAVGVGYEWGSVSDDLANIDYDGGGAFLNIVGRF